MIRRERRRRRRRKVRIFSIENLSTSKDSFIDEDNTKVRIFP